MKGFYDKIIFAVGALALAASGGYYAMQQGASVPQLTPRVPSGPNYEALASDTMKSYASVWDDPVSQDEAGNELYDVFTPPKIWWEEDKKEFRFEPPKKEKEVEIIPFGIKLVALEQELYRIQLEAYFEALTGEDKDASILLVDTESNTPFRGKIGSKFPEHEAEIVDFEVKREVTDVDGSLIVRMVPYVTIKDESSGESIRLTTEERLYIPNSYSLTFETLKPYPNQTIVWEDKGEEQKVGDVTFKLLEFDFDKQSAKVEKTFADEKPQETKTLFVSEPKPSEPLVQDTKEENGSSGEIPSEFNDFFQN